MHKKLDNLAVLISKGNRLNPDILVNFAVKKTLANLSHHNFLLIFSAFEQTDKKQTAQYLYKIFKHNKVDDNKIIELYANKVIELFIVEYYKNLPNFLYKNNKSVTSPQ